MDRTNPNNLRPDYIKNPKPYAKQRDQGYLPALLDGRGRAVFVSRKGYKTATLAKQRAGQIHERWKVEWDTYIMSMTKQVVEPQAVEPEPV